MREGFTIARIIATASIRLEIKFIVAFVPEVFLNLKTRLAKITAVIIPEKTNGNSKIVLILPASIAAWAKPSPK